MSYTPTISIDLAETTLTFANNNMHWCYAIVTIDTGGNTAEIIASEAHIDPLDYWESDSKIYYKLGHFTAVTNGRREACIIWGNTKNRQPIITYNPVTITTVFGTLASGSVGDLAVKDGSVVVWNEATGANSLEVQLAYGGVEDLTQFIFFGHYDGGAGHYIDVEMYNYNTSAWENIGTMMAETSSIWYTFPIHNGTDYIDAGVSEVRFKHYDTGVPGHHLELDYAVLKFGAAGSGGVSEHSALTGLDHDDHLQYFNETRGDARYLQKGITEDIAFEFRDVEFGTSQTWILDIKASFDYTIESAVLESDDDETDISIEIESTAVTGLGAIDLTANTIADTAATAANAVTTGEQVTIVTSGTDGGANTLLRGKLRIIRS